MTIPANAAVLQGSQWLGATASSAVDVARVEFHLTGGALNNVLIGTATPTTYGWLYRWDSTTVANGGYFLQSVAYDSAGAAGTSTAIGITVNN
ncbi:MAG: hypothetical protein IVW52_11830 [Acidimicrobiales bacterium]|nr:hypothetical protein [Acidimicrobiales bacterium]